jgi:hypothetical protein
MNIRINEIQSQVKTTPSPSLLDPAVLKEIVRLCVREMKNELERAQRDAKERSIHSGPGDRERD